jgi:hypothetical protein
VSDMQSGKGSTPREVEDQRDRGQYPINHVLAILATPDQTSCAVDALVSGGFFESEIDLGHGPEVANQVAGTTGRSGVQDWFIRLFQQVGLKNAEIELKDDYEKALRDGQTVIAVLTPTEERKNRAAAMLRECGARFINYYARLNVERLSG